jgi:hypothetical protein
MVENQEATTRQGLIIIALVLAILAVAATELFHAFWNLLE